MNRPEEMVYGIISQNGGNYTGMYRKTSDTSGYSQGYDPNVFQDNIPVIDYRNCDISEIMDKVTFGFDNDYYIVETTQEIQTPVLKNRKPKTAAEFIEFLKENLSGVIIHDSTELKRKYNYKMNAQKDIRDLLKKYYSNSISVSVEIKDGKAYVQMRIGEDYYTLETLPNEELKSRIFLYLSTPKIPFDNIDKDRRRNILLGICSICGKDATRFKDELSYKEFNMSGMCQDCQDGFFDKDEEE